MGLGDMGLGDKGLGDTAPFGDIGREVVAFGDIGLLGNVTSFELVDFLLILDFRIFWYDIGWPYSVDISSGLLLDFSVWIFLLLS